MSLLQKYFRTSFLFHLYADFWAFFRAFFLLFLVIANWALYSYHAGVFPRPPATSLRMTGIGESRFIEKAEFGVHQLILSGTAYERGLHAGQLTEKILLRQEQELVGKLQGWFPNPFVLQGLILVAIDWFQGIEPFFEPWMTAEMYGVAKSAPKQYDYLADGFTRQIAYHGLHEVGQMTVDQKGDDIGCTVVGTPYKNGWILGRNFDFEGGRIFDEDKIMKWVFPEKGNAFLSVIWAGMVGAVTGVNDHGLYLSINAAGSTDFKRLGTPSTLVVLKVLQFANNVDEAIALLKSEKMFITDILVLMDAKTGKLYRIEKSPLHTEVLPLAPPVVVTNHLLADRWKSDPINLFRKLELTSAFREERGKRLVSQLDQERLTNPVELETRVLAILRDKGEVDGEALTIGNRRAIDPLIAAHSVIYNGPDQTFFVSQGPGVSGPFAGFDLKASFRERKPVPTRKLSRDPLVSDQDFADFHASERLIAEADQALKKGLCGNARNILQGLETQFGKFTEQTGYYLSLGNSESCSGHMSEARAAWQRALRLHPAYVREVNALKEKLAR